MNIAQQHQFSLGNDERRKKGFSSHLYGSDNLSYSKSIGVTQNVQLLYIFCCSDHPTPPKRLLTRLCRKGDDKREAPIR